MVKLIFTFKKNNVHINLSQGGNTLSKFSFKHKTNLNVIAQHLNEHCSLILKKLNPLLKINIFILGYNPSIYKIIRNLYFSHNKVNQIFYISKRPFNGCRRKKIRRLLT